MANERPKQTHNHHLRRNNNAETIDQGGVHACRQAGRSAGSGTNRTHTNQQGRCGVGLTRKGPQPPQTPPKKGEHSARPLLRRSVIVYRAMTTHQHSAASGHRSVSRDRLLPGSRHGESVKAHSTPGSRCHTRCLVPLGGARQFDNQVHGDQPPPAVRTARHHHPPPPPPPPWPPPDSAFGSPSTLSSSAASTPRLSTCCRRSLLSACSCEVRSRAADSCRVRESCLASSSAARTTSSSFSFFLRSLERRALSRFACAPSAACWSRARGCQQGAQASGWPRWIACHAA